MLRKGILTVLSVMVLSLTVNAWAESVHGHGGEHAKPEYPDHRGHMSMGGYGYEYSDYRDHRRHDSHRSKHSIVRLLKKAQQLGLSEEQINSIKAIKTAKQKECIMLNAKRETLEIDLNALLHNKNVDRAKVNEMLDEIGNTSIQVRKVEIMSILDALDVLTEAQKEQYKKELKHKKHKMSMKSHD